MTIVTTLFVDCPVSYFTPYKIVADTKFYAADLSYLTTYKYIGDTVLYDYPYSLVDRAILVVPTKNYGAGVDVIGVPWRANAVYYMSGWDTIGNQWVSWRTSDQYKTPTVTTPPSIGPLTKVRILHSIDMQDLKFYWHPVAKDLVESTDTGVVSVPIEDNSSLSVVIQYTIDSDDGTDFQTLSGMTRILAVNKGGTITVSTPNAIDSDDTLCSSGTLTNTVTVTAGTGEITINFNAASSLSQTTLQATWRLWWNGNTDSITTL